MVARHLGSLRIDGDVVGAEVLVDGQLVGALPMSAAIRVVAGPVAVEVRAPGRVTVRREVTIAAVVREFRSPTTTRMVACPGIRSGSQPARCATLVDRTGSMETIATAAFVGAGILAAATTVLFLTGSGRSSARAQVPRFACGFGPGMASIQCAGRF
ncbi:MAG: PEGA domain-containing protein [Deltaproteobacteria bacterium]|nr:PEGA domain-containing protein [Deltaproteobacteria bacterium]